jgi:hypothetical protein
MGAEIKCEDDDTGLVVTNKPYMGKRAFWRKALSPVGRGVCRANWKR